MLLRFYYNRPRPTDVWSEYERDYLRSRTRIPFAATVHSPHLYRSKWQPEISNRCCADTGHIQDKRLLKVTGGYNAFLDTANQRSVTLPYTYLNLRNGKNLTF